MAITLDVDKFLETVAPLVVPARTHSIMSTLDIDRFLATWAAPSSHASMRADLYALLGISEFTNAPACEYCARGIPIEDKTTNGRPTHYDLGEHVECGNQAWPYNSARSKKEEKRENTTPYAPN